MTSYASVNGTRIAYKELNKRASRPLVMFNGTALNYECWKPLSTRLDRHMIMIDLPGIGGSSIYDRPPSMNRYVDDLMFVIYGMLEKDQDIEPFDICGYSFGGALAQAISAKYDDVVNKKVLLSTTPGFSGAIPSFKAIRMSMTFGKAFVSNLFGNKSDDGDIVKNFKAPNPLGPLYSTGALIHWSKQKRKTDTTNETLIVHGSHDDLLPLKNAITLHTLHTKSDLDILPGADHLAPLVHAEYVADRINTFLEK